MEHVVTGERLPSWRPGGTRQAVLDFLDASTSRPVVERVAYFDNDGTLWCERPGYVQFDFFVDGLRRRSKDDPSLAERPELAAVLDNDLEAMASIGLVRIALALAGLFAGLSPEAFTEEARQFMGAGRHAALDRPLTTIVYGPMLELLDELRRLDFTIGIVTGGGTEFVRAVSDQLYGVPPELVVGTLVEYELARDDAGRPVAHRTARILGEANEGAAKVTNIQTQLGRRPILAAGNSAGDREMLEWAMASGAPSLALLVDHDDAEREYQYQSLGETTTETEAITDVAARLGWTTISMRDDWETVFPSAT